MEIGISSACFYPHVETENCIALMKKIGFDSGEIFLNSPFEYEEDFVNTLYEEKEKYNFKINSVHAFCATFEPFLFDRYKRRRTDMLKYFRKVCKACSYLEGNYYSFHGMRNLEFKDLDMNFILEIYKELSYIAGEENIKLAQENVSWCMSSDLNFLKVLKEKCEYPIYFTLDLKQAYKAGKLPKDYIDVMESSLVNIHINDRDENNVCLLPGNGDIDYLELSNQLKKIYYKGSATIEVYNENIKNYEELKKSKKLLLSIL